jgi:hypothetical protein
MNLTYSFTVYRWRKRQTENRNLKRNLQVKKKDKYETEGTSTNATVCKMTRIIH